ncbi:MAG: hypothetical protein K1000chlam2_01307 [Chlamydiae bacterium]|nr:hypothetical protein [Chlamydiota bacterium]
MKKILLFLLAVPLVAFSMQEDFEILMGKETPGWKYVQTPEDIQRIQFFSDLFQKQACRCKSESNRIPKTIHFIWLGPQPFPQSSIERLEKWKSLHPNWKLKFWTDIDRDCPIEKMKKCFISKFSMHMLQNEFDDSINFGEKAKILAYEILWNEGGIYVDHDCVPFKAFDELNSQFDFYCGLEKLGPSVLSSSVIPGTHIIAAKPKHPILEESIHWLKNHWYELEQNYPGQSEVALANRVLHRTFWALSEGIDREIGKKDNVDVVFPSFYFSERYRKASSYAVHYHEAMWSHNPSKFEKKVQRQFTEMVKNDDEAVVITLFLAGVSFFACFILVLYARGARREAR